MDAVFSPLVVRDSHILAQEGWRYELTPKNKEQEDVDCTSTPDVCELRYSGVVLSEMKGSWGEPDAAEWRYRMSLLFPDMPTHKFSSGGDPAAIPQLTFQHLQAFYELHYTPANAWLTFYGPDDVAARLSFVDDYLQELRKARTYPTRHSFILPQTPFPQPKYAERLFASSSSPLTDIVTVSWVLNPCPADSECKDWDGLLQVAWRVLKHLLIGTKTSPLYKALADSKLGTAVIDDGVSFTFKHATFTVGLKGVPQRETAAQEVQKVVLKTLKTLSIEGFSNEEVAAALNYVEFQLREFPRDPNLPRGLKFTRLMANEITYDRDPMVGIRFADDFSRLRKALALGVKVFQRVIIRYLLHNGHQLTLRMKASPTLARETASFEQQKLEAIKAHLTQRELKAIVELQEDLKKKQGTPPSAEDMQKLPMLERGDIDVKGEEIPLQVEAVKSVPLVTHELPTGGLVYVEAALSLSDLSIDDVPYVPLLVRMLSEAGTMEHSPDRLLPIIGRTTGGIEATYAFGQAAAAAYTVPDPLAVRGFLFLSGKASGSRSVDLWCLLHEILADTNFHNAVSGQQIVKKLISEREDMFRKLAFKTASRSAQSAFGAGMLMDEATDGYSSLLFHRQLVRQAESDWGVIANRLAEIMGKLLQRQNVAFNVTGDASSLFMATQGTPRQLLTSLIEAIPGETDTSQPPEGAAVEPAMFDRVPRWATEAKERGLLVPAKKAYLVHTQVTDTCLSSPFQPPGEAIVGSDVVGAAYLESVFLWNTVRERQGAYGAWCRINSEGVISFMSYRDPKALDTLQAFRSASTVVADFAEKAQEGQILEAVLPAISNLDRPEAVEQLGRKSFWQWVRREKMEHRNTYRDQIINTDKEQFKTFAKRLKEALEAKREAVILIGPVAAVKEVTESGEALEMIEVN